MPGKSQPVDMPFVPEKIVVPLLVEIGDEDTRGGPPIAPRALAPELAVAVFPVQLAYSRENTFPLRHDFLPSQDHTPAVSTIHALAGFDLLVHSLLARHTNFTLRHGQTDPQEGAIDVADMFLTRGQLPVIPHVGSVIDDVVDRVAVRFPLFKQRRAAAHGCSTRSICRRVPGWLRSAVARKDV